MRERKAQLQQAMARSRVLLQDRVAAMPALVRARDRSRRRRVLWLCLLLMLLLLLWSRCSCEAPLPEERQLQDAGVAITVRQAPPPPATKARALSGRVRAQARPALQTQTNPSPPWLQEFRLQVAARSPRLAQCFSGIPQPGALRWTTLVDDKTGRVADHSLDVVGADAGLTSSARVCVLETLANPPYRIEAVVGQQERALPSRVSLLIEF